MKLHLPDPNILVTTGSVDYAHWNYQFPIKYIQQFRFKALLKFMGDKRYDRLLEVGTGSGIFLPELSRHCHSIYAIDVHDKMTAVESLCHKLSIDAKLKRCGIESTPFPDNFFDIIIAVSVLEFVNDLDMALDEIKRILKPEGFFLTICPQQSPLLDAILNLYTRRTPDAEFGATRKNVYLKLEKSFSIVEKKIFPPIVSKLIPVYNYYKLSKSNHHKKEG
jgi:ubiquinone/menaquinone biosynthesis C-methylase UbiE